MNKRTNWRMSGMKEAKCPNCSKVVYKRITPDKSKMTPRCPHCGQSIARSRFKVVK